MINSTFLQKYTCSLVCQVAEKQGKYIANKLNKNSGKEFEFKHAGMLAYIGSYEGLSDLPRGKLQGMDWADSEL